jgi:hypothetical protein
MSASRHVPNLVCYFLLPSGVITLHALSRQVIQVSDQTPQATSYIPCTNPTDASPGDVSGSEAVLIY